MKKNLLAIAAVLVGISASATPFSVANKIKLVPGGCPGMHMMELTEPIVTEGAIVSRAEASDEEVDYTLAGNPANSLGLQLSSGAQIAMAAQIEPSFLSQLSDAEITGITFYTGSDQTTRRNEIKKGWVFITDNLSGDFIYTQEVNLPSTQYTRVDVELTTPFVIPADNKIYIGVYETLTSPTNTPLVIDLTGHLTDLGGWAAYRTSPSGKWSWNNVSSSYGFFTIGATIKGKGFPKHNVSVVEIAGQPVTAENEPFAFQFMLQNNGVDVVKTITLEYGIENEELTTKELPINQGDWTMNQVIIASAESKSPKASKGSKVILNIKKVNGEENTSEDASGAFSIVIVPAGSDLKRNVVIEEFTSINCPYCPTGYTAMEDIHDNYTDGSVIPVCVHGNFNGRDPMTATSFSSLYNRYSSSIPFATINRQYDMYPSYDDFVEYAEGIKALPGVVQVSAKAKLDAETRILSIDTESSFAFDYTDADKNFILAFGITEDNVGPYTQKNGYAGTSYNVPGDWAHQPSAVSLIYNDVARQLDKYAGVTGSVPAEVKAGETYKYSHEMKLVSTIEDFDKIHVIVYVINLNDRTIENSYTLTSDGSGNYAGIEAVTVDNDEDAPVEYYNLQGVRVKNPANGVYIRRQGNKVSKVFLH